MITKITPVLMDNRAADAEIGFVFKTGLITL